MNSPSSLPPAVGEAAHTPNPPDLYLVNAPRKVEDFWEQDINSRSDSGVIVLIAVSDTKQDAIAEAENTIRACNAHASDQAKIKGLVEEHESNAKIYDYMSDVELLKQHGPLLAEIRRRAREVLAQATQGEGR